MSTKYDFIASPCTSTKHSAIYRVIHQRTSNQEGGRKKRKKSQSPSDPCHTRAPAVKRFDACAAIDASSTRRALLGRARTTAKVLATHVVRPDARQRQKVPSSAVVYVHLHHTTASSCSRSMLLQIGISRIQECRSSSRENSRHWQRHCKASCNV